MVAMSYQIANFKTVKESGFILLNIMYELIFTSSKYFQIENNRINQDFM